MTSVPKTATKPATDDTPTPNGETTQAEQAALTAPGAASSSGGKGGLISIVVLVAVLGGGIAAYPSWSPLVPADVKKSLFLDTLIPPVREAAWSLLQGDEATPAQDKGTIAAPVEGAATPAPAPASSDETGAAPAPVAEPEPQVETPAEIPAEAATATAPVLPAPQPQVPADAVVERAQDTDKTAALADALASVAERLQGLEDRLGTVAEVAQAAVSAAAQPSGPSASEQALAGRMAALEEKLAVIEALAHRMTALEARQNTAAAQVLAQPGGPLAFAVDSLSDAMRTAQPFRLALDDVLGLAEKDAALRAALAEVTPLADKGAPTHAALQASFADVATQAARARPVMEGEGWVERVVNKAASLVSVRAIDAEQAANPIDAALARAETSLAKGDLQAAVVTLSEITGPSAEALGSWLADARARLAVNAATRNLSRQMVARFAPKAVTAPEPVKE